MQPGTTYSGYYYPAGTYGYSSMYVTPGYTTSYPMNAPVQRRGLFGGLFGRRNRMAYRNVPYGYTYGTAPSTYTYGAAPSTYTYGASPY
jgi:hypothetical protein